MAQKNLLQIYVLLLQSVLQADLILVYAKVTVWSAHRSESLGEKIKLRILSTLNIINALILFRAGNLCN